MSKKTHSIVHDNPNILNIELGAGCGNFGNTFHSKCFLTDIKNPNDNCSSLTSGLFFISDATKISEHVPNYKFELVICCNPYNYGFKNPLDAFSILEQFTKILKPNEGKVLIIGAKGQNGYCNSRKIARFITEFNSENNTNFAIHSENILRNQYVNFSYTDHLGIKVVPNYEIIISN